MSAKRLPQQFDNRFPLLDIGRIIEDGIAEQDKMTHNSTHQNQRWHQPTCVPADLNPPRYTEACAIACSRFTFGQGET